MSEYRFYCTIVNMNIGQSDVFIKVVNIKADSTKNAWRDCAYQVINELKENESLSTIELAAVR